MDGYKLANKYDETNDNESYWTDGKKVYFRHCEIKGADAGSFIQYPGCWAMDKRNCFSGSSKSTTSP
jgi:hypothetical protein